MSETAASTAPAATSRPSEARSESKGMMIGRWAARLVAAGILAMGAIPKFTGQAGALADVLPGGMGAVYAIGAIEAVAIVLLLIPRTGLYGAGLAAMLMLGAVLSHFGPVGFEGDFAMMFGMAIVALLAASAATWLEWTNRPSAGT